MKTLLVVDAQKDFMPGGSLAVPDADQIVPFINKIRSRYDLVIWTKDWHPSNHCSFKENGGIWPVHCVQNTKGSELHNDLVVGVGEYVVTKGTQRLYDSYSAFKDDGDIRTGLATMLKYKKVTELDICGLATEYCLKFTVLDALEDGFKVNVLSEGCRGIGCTDITSAFDEMIGNGAIIK